MSRGEIYIDIGTTGIDRVWFVDPTRPTGKALVIGRMSKTAHEAGSTNQTIMKSGNQARIPLDQDALRRALLDTYGDEK